MTGDNLADIALVRKVVLGSGQQTETLRLFSLDGAQIRQVATSFTAANDLRRADGIALGNVNAGSRAEIIVANV